MLKMAKPPAVPRMWILVALLLLLGLSSLRRTEVLRSSNTRAFIHIGGDARLPGQQQQVQPATTAPEALLQQQQAAQQQPAEASLSSSGALSLPPLRIPRLLHVNYLSGRAALAADALQPLSHFRKEWWASCSVSHRHCAPVCGRGLCCLLLCHRQGCESATPLPNPCCSLRPPRARRRTTPAGGWCFGMRPPARRCWLSTTLPSCPSGAASTAPCCSRVRASGRCHARCLCCVRVHACFFTCTMQVRAQAHALHTPADAMRPFILHRHGGVYLDLDSECFSDMTPWLAGAHVVLQAEVC